MHSLAPLRIGRGYRLGMAYSVTDLRIFAGVPRKWVHIVFHEYPVGNGYSAGRTSPTAALTLLIRTGRSADYKREMLRRLWALVQAATGTPDEEIVLGIQEVPASQAMEMGQIMPEVDSS
jgi:hypothetical protein